MSQGLAAATSVQSAEVAAPDAGGGTFAALLGLGRASGHRWRLDERQTHCEQRGMALLIWSLLECVPFVRGRGALVRLAMGDTLRTLALSGWLWPPLPGAWSCFLGVEVENQYFCSFSG